MSLTDTGPVLSHSSLLLLPPKAVGASRSVLGCLPQPHPFSLPILLLRQKRRNSPADQPEYEVWVALRCWKGPFWPWKTTLLVVPAVLCTTSQRPATNWAVHLRGNRAPGVRDGISFLGSSSRAKLLNWEEIITQLQQNNLEIYSHVLSVISCTLLCLAIKSKLTLSIASVKQKLVILSHGRHSKGNVPPGHLENHYFFLHAVKLLQESPHSLNFHILSNLPLLQIKYRLVSLIALYEFIAEMFDFPRTNCLSRRYFAAKQIT